MQNRPYTTKELLHLLTQHRGINPHTAYINNVIFNKRRSIPHPLARAYLARGMWDRETVDAYLQSKKPSA